jgi:3-oxoadipate enol-lactonase
MRPEQMIAHRIEGEGEPVLLLNGGMMTYSAWEPVAKHLRNEYRLIFCDLRGQLLSPGPAPSELADNVADLAALLDHLEIEKAHVIGTSYGGEVALLLAALRAERVLSLIGVTVSDHVTDSILVGSKDLRRLLADDLTERHKRGLYDRLVEDVYSDSFKLDQEDELAARRSQVGKLPDGWFRDLEGILGAMEGLDLRSEAKGIDCPTMIVIAGDDRVIPPEHSYALAAAIRGSETRLLETSGHAMVVEAPEWLAETCLDFLSRHRSGMPSRALD